MSTKPSAHLVAHRAELMAELFLQSLGPALIFRSSVSDMGFDFLLGVENMRRGLDFIAVEVKSTERAQVGRFRVQERTLAVLASSNLPGLLLVVDVKRNRIWAWFAQAMNASDAGELSVPVEDMTGVCPDEVVERLRQHVASWGSESA